MPTSRPSTPTCQFVDHDITLESSSFTAADLLADDLEPLALDQIRTGLHNIRTATLELDSVYSPPAPLDPTNPAKLLVGTVSSLNGTDKPLLRPPGKARQRPAREPRSPDIARPCGADLDPAMMRTHILAQLLWLS